MTGFYTHRKTAKLRSKIGNDAFWVPPRLWAYCAENQPDGDISGYEADEIGMLIGYPSNTQAMLEALKECGFVDPDGKIHDWEEHNCYHNAFSVRAKTAAAARWAKKNPPHTPPDPETVEIGQRTEDRGASNAYAMLEHPPSIHPSFSDVETECQLRGFDPVEGKRFWEHFESSGWIDKNGHAIAKWRPRLSKWCSDARALPAQNQFRNGRRKPNPDIL